ncbi:MAG TPA: hypothetical protein VJY36_03355 [Candidatus Bathyarchaeia archaeon]|nr:hypothetical protein [Candidatus Bathyarchaeia archaeon]
MTNEQNFNQKQEIIQQIQKLRQEANNANVQIKNCVDRRNELNEGVKKSREEINHLKAERDQINERVKVLKSQRNAIRAQSDPITEDINASRAKIAELKKTLPRESQRALQEEHDAIEWKISTTSLDLQEEKRLIENVKQLEILLRGYKKIDAHNTKIKNLLAQRKTFDEQADVLHKELTELASKSQEIHSKMIEKVNFMNISRAQADGQHQLFIKTKEETIPQIYEKIGQLVGQLNSVKAEMAKEAKTAAEIRASERAITEKANQEQQQSNKEKEQAIKEKIGAEARNKLQKGEKVSWDEFQLMMDDDSKEDSETQD